MFTKIITIIKNIIGCIKRGEIPDNLFVELKRAAEHRAGQKFQYISGNEARKIFRAAFDSPVKYITPARDAKYALLPDALLDEFNTIYRKFIAKYEREVFDCDNFAIDYSAAMYRYGKDIPNLSAQLAVGFLSGNFSWLKNHQAVLFINDKKEVKLLEPQRPKVYSISKEDVIKYIYM